MFIDKCIDIGGAGKELDKSVAQEIFTDLELYLNEPIARISQDYWSRKETTDKEEQDRIAKNEDKNEILDYYKTNEQYLYELTYWEALRSKQIEFKKLYLCCRKLKINKLLDFGGGIGGLGIFMAQHDLRCDYLDVAGKTFDFAEWRFNRKKIDINACAGLEELPDSVYGGVVAYDVLEHLFNVEGTVKEIARILTKGGYFISRSSFGEEGVHLPKNKKFEDIKTFNELMQRCSFNFCGQLKPDYFSQFLKKAGIKSYLSGIRIKNRLKYGGNFIVHQKT